MKFTTHTKNDVVFFNLSGDLIGAQDSFEIINEASNHIEEGRLKCIIDISELRYINSSGIGILITLLTKFRNKGGEVCLLNPSENVQKLLIITKLNAIFTVANSEEEALEKLKIVE
ncbi:MAG: STAS domain-containing protein [Candidatus Cyclobacteriaceae bacterium M2_1C_046]